MKGSGVVGVAVGVVAQGLGCLLSLTIWGVGMILAVKRRES